MGTTDCESVKDKISEIEEDIGQGQLALDERVTHIMRSSRERKVNKKYSL